MHKYIRSSSITFEKIDNNLLLLNPKTTKAFECNEIITDLWEVLESEMSFEEIIQTLLEEYEVDKEELTNDIKATLDKMIERELILKK